MFPFFWCNLTWQQCYSAYMLTVSSTSVHIFIFHHGLIFPSIWLDNNEEMPETWMYTLHLSFLFRRISSQASWFLNIEIRHLCNQSLSTNLSLNGCMKMAWLGKAQPLWKKNAESKYRDVDNMEALCLMICEDSRSSRLIQFENRALFGHKQMQNYAAIFFTVFAFILIQKV